MSSEEEEIDWQKEAAAVIADVHSFVNYIQISQKVDADKQCVYLNIETKETRRFCVELSSCGFRICGEQFDSIENEKNTDRFETIYALLDTVSGEYRRSFGNSLIDKLNDLQNTTEQR